MFSLKRYTGLLITSLIFFVIFIVGMVSINQINTVSFKAERYLNRFVDLKDSIVNHSGSEQPIQQVEPLLSKDSLIDDSFIEEPLIENPLTEDSSLDPLNDNVITEAIEESEVITELAIELEDGVESADTAHYNQLLDKLDLINSGESSHSTGSQGTLPPLDSIFENTQELLFNLETALIENNKATATSAIEAVISSIESQILKKDKLKFSLIGIIAAAGLLIFVAIIVQIIRLGKTDETSTAVSQESEGIMATVSEGLFLLDADSNIGIEQSASLKHMFDKEDDLEGNFFEFIGEYVSPKDVDTARDFIKILFGKKKVKESLIKDLNPLNQVQVHISRRDGSYEIRYLKFNFNRVYKGDELEHLLVSTSDITREVTLAAELEEAKEKGEAQIDLMMSILQVDSTALARFFETASQSLTKVNDILKDRGHNESQVRKKVDEIFRLVHNVKGDSASLKLYSFEGSVHIVEDELVKLRGNPNVTGKDLLGLTSYLKDSFLELEKMRSIIEKIGSVKVTSSSDSSDLNDEALTPNLVTEKKLNVAVINTLHRQVSEREEKNCTLYLTGMDDSNIPEHLHETIQTLSVQLIRNAIVHGIETSEQRIESRKRGEAKIICRFSRSPKGHYIFSIQDNGAGIDDQSITKKALEKGFLSSEQVSQITTPEDILQLLCAPGYSSKDEATLNAGRGVGLDIVKEIVTENKGKIQLSYKKGEFCKFAIAFPEHINSEQS